MNSREAHQAARQRRRQKRRRRGRVAVKGLVMGAMIFGAQAKPKANHKYKEGGIATAEVHVSMDSFAAIPAYLAYDDIIDEAASKFDLDADLIHAVIQTESGYNAL